MKKIGVVIAQRKECENLFTKLGNCEIIDLYAGFSVNKFVVGGKEVYFTESGVGEIKAAIATQKLIDIFNVDVVINFGVAGGLKRGTRGNIYIVKGVCHYDFDTTPIDNTGRGRYLDFPSAVIDTDSDMIDLLKSLAPSAELAVCASGDKFICDDKIKEGLAEEFGATICEMESAGVLITSKLANKPCAVIKIVSDDSADPEDYYRFLQKMTDDLNVLIEKFLNII